MKLSLSTILDFETGKRGPIRNNLDAMQQALEAGGIRLMFDAEGKPAGITIDDAGLIDDQKPKSS